MKKIAMAAMAALVALSPVSGTALAQGKADAGRKPVQQSIQKQQPTHIQPGKQQLPGRQQQRAGGQAWKKGGKYSGKGAAVGNYGRHNLKAPPQGHRWVRDGNDFLLVAIGTGVIASIVAGAAK